MARQEEEFVADSESEEPELQCYGFFLDNIVGIQYYEV